MRIPKKPADFINTADNWTGGVGQRFKAFKNNFAESNGAIPSCAGRTCEFYRRECCWRESVGIKCVWPYYWRRVDKDGNVLDRDGRIIYTKEQVEEYKM